MFDRVDAPLEHCFLMIAEKFNEFLSPIPMNSSRLRDVISHRWQEVLVKLDQMVQTALCNIQCTQTGQEIVSNEEAEENEVVDDSLDIKPELELAIQLLVF